MSSNEIKKGSWVHCRRTNLYGRVQEVRKEDLRIKLDSGTEIYEFIRFVRLLPPPPAIGTDIAHAELGRGEVLEILSATMVECRFYHGRRSYKSKVTVTSIWPVPKVPSRI